MANDDQKKAMVRNDDETDFDGAKVLAEKLSMKIVEGAKDLVDSNKAPDKDADIDSYSSNEDRIDIPIEPEEETDEEEVQVSKIKRDSLSLKSHLKSKKADVVSDDSSLTESDGEYCKKPDVNSESSDSDQNVDKKEVNNSPANSVSSDSAFYDKMPTKEKSCHNDLEKVKVTPHDDLDNLKVRNVKFSVGDKNDNTSQCSSDNNDVTDNVTNRHRRRGNHSVHFYDNKAFSDTETESPRRRSAAVSFAGPVIGSDDDRDEYDDDDNDDFEESATDKQDNEKERRRRQDFISAITSLLSLMYGGMVMLLGFVFPLTEALHSKWLTTTSVALFNVYLYLTSAVFLICMSFDFWSWIDHYFPRMSSKPQLRGRRGGASEKGEIANDDSDEESHSMTDEIYTEVMGLRQTASLGHEGASFYLRLGALIFGIANFIYVVIQIDQYYKQRAFNCLDMPEVYPMYFHLVFVGVQTFYVFKDTTVKVRRFRAIARFGFMHVLATNMCNWLRILVFEVMEGMYKTQKEIAKREMDTMPKNASVYNGYNNHTHGYNDHGSPKDDHGYSGSDDNGGNYSQTSCLHLEGLYTSIAPYLFPFVLEYSLIAAATMAGMYQSLNIRVTEDVIKAVKKTVMNRRKSSADLGALLQSKLEAENMFAKSHRGMYGGAVLLAGALISMIMFHYTIGGDADEEDKNKALEIYLISDIALHVLLMPPLIYCAVRFSKFKFSFNRENTIDDTLLLLSLSGLVLYYSFVMLTSATGLLFLEETPEFHFHRTTVISMVYALCNIVQSILQGIFVIAGLQLCAPNRKTALDKPGRGAITFLLIGNLSLWLFKSFQVKEVSLHKFVYFYGPTAWPIIINTCLPLVLFYRFHVSVCLADIWASVYKPETGPQHKMVH